VLGDEWTARFLAPHVKQMDLDGGGAAWIGFAFEFKLDSKGAIVHMDKEGENAGVDSLLAYFPATDTTVVLLANVDYDVWTMFQEIEPLVAG